MAEVSQNDSEEEVSREQFSESRSSLLFPFSSRAKSSLERAEPKVRRTLWAFQRTLVGVFLGILVLINGVLLLFPGYTAASALSSIIFLVVLLNIVFPMLAGPEAIRVLSTRESAKTRRRFGVDHLVAETFRPFSEIWRFVSGVSNSELLLLERYLQTKRDLQRLEDLSLAKELEHEREDVREIISSLTREDL